MAGSKRTSHCNKVGFTTLLAAQITAKRMKAKKRGKGEPIATHLSVYKCEHCPKFHIGRDRVKGIDWNEVERHEKKIREGIAQRVAENRSKP